MFRALRPGAGGGGGGAPAALRVRPGQASSSPQCNRTSLKDDSPAPAVLQ